MQETHKSTSTEVFFISFKQSRVFFFYDFMLSDILVKSFRRNWKGPSVHSVYVQYEAFFPAGQTNYIATILTVISILKKKREPVKTLPGNSIIKCADEGHLKSTYQSNFSEFD